MKTNDWKKFGKRSLFAFEYRFKKDPDRGRGATSLEAASWGEFCLWVRDKNLCLHHDHGQFHDTVTWYLLPLLAWLAENWDPLFHEERFPVPCEKLDARAGYMDSLRRYLGDTDPNMQAKSAVWYAWWERHGLRSCRQGGVFPDVFVRRLMDFAEISWGNMPIAGTGEDFYFAVPMETALLPVEQVAEPLLQGLRDAVLALQAVDASQEMMALAACVQEIAGAGRWRTRLAWYAERMVEFLDLVPDQIRGGLEQSQGFIRRLAPSGGIMFGALAPEIGRDDVATLFHAFVTAHQGDRQESELLRTVTRQDPSFPEKEPLDEGYDSALDLLDALHVTEAGGGWVDVHAVCQQLAIEIVSVDLTDSNIRGAAFAGRKVTPTILVNRAHRNNQQPHGQRFTLGHELCHILNDRFFGGDVAVVTTPWAPAVVEERANAFAAMLLMPLELINARIQHMVEPLDSVEGIILLADQLQVSRRAVLWHLYNLGKLDSRQRVRLERDLAGTL
ncbi:MAG: ImmA/IrrE family metallo-endopeptidase [Magnetococcales bacterium]|nr:ImmA/IrrE family metallo-endopeptidase [Magnetococcales bacterium]